MTAFVLISQIGFPTCRLLGSRCVLPVFIALILPHFSNLMSEILPRPCLLSSIIFDKLRLVLHTLNPAFNSSTNTPSCRILLWALHDSDRSFFHDFAKLFFCVFLYPRSLQILFYETNIIATPFPPPTSNILIFLTLTIGKNFETRN